MERCRPFTAQPAKPVLVALGTTVTRLPHRRQGAAHRAEQLKVLILCRTPWLFARIATADSINHPTLASVGTLFTETLAGW